MKEYILDAHVHIRACVECESEDEFYNIASDIVCGKYEGIWELEGIEGTMEPTG